MKLELGFVAVRDVAFGPQTRMEDGVLYINKEEAEALVLEDEKIAGASIELVYPGDGTRIVNIQDIVEPRCKITPAGADFPGWLSKIQNVGYGETCALRGTAVVLCNMDSDRQFHSILDMGGDTSRVTPFARMPLVVLASHKKAEGFTYTEYDFAIHKAQFKLAVYLAKAGVGQPVAEKAVYEHDLHSIPADSPLPRVAYFYQMYTPQYDHLGIPEPIFYGTEVKEMLPTIINPNEVLDGGIVCYFPCKSLTTYSIQNHAMIRELYARHGKDLLFCGMIVAVAHMEPSQRDRRAMVSSRLAKDVLKADGLVMTKVHGGMVHMDLACTAEACERLGVKAIPINQGLVSSGTIAENALFKSDLIPGIIHMGVTMERIRLQFKPKRILGGTGETVFYTPDQVFMQAKDEDISVEQFLIPGIHDHMGSSPIVARDY